MFKKMMVLAVCILTMSFVFCFTTSEASNGIDSGLVAYWSFNDQDNVGYDDTGNGYNGTVYGATWIEEGLFGGAVSFDGVDDHISIPIDDYFSDSYTASVWFKTTSGSANILVDQESLPKAPIHIIVWNNEVWAVIQDSNGDSIQVSSNPDTFIDGEPHHVVAVRSGGDFGEVTLELFVDGVSYGTETKVLADTAVPGFPLEIGRRSPDGPWEFQGTIDEVRIYDRPLTGEEVLNLFNYDPGAEPRTPQTFADIDVKKFLIMKHKYRNQASFFTRGICELPDLSYLNDGDVIEARMTIELIGSAPNGGDIIMSDEEIYLEVKKWGKLFVIKKKRMKKWER